MRILTAIVAKEARQDIEQRLKGYGVEITALQYRVLRQLQQQQGHPTIKELSQTLMVEPATLVPVMDTLERHSLVRRGRDPRDPRDRHRMPLELTERGEEHISRIPFVHDEDVLVRYLRQLPAQERSVFVAHLRDLVTMMHGYDEAVRRIRQAVEDHVAFGAHQQQQ